jgi:hypothetical protein
MRWIAFVATALLVIAQGAGAASWSAFGFSTTPQNLPQVQAAGDSLMTSEVGKKFPGRLILQANIADGDNRASNAWVPIYKSAAEREAWVQELQADPAWAAFQKTIAGLAEPVSSSMYRTVRSWGDIADTDTVWMTHSVNVSDPAAYLAALEKFRASPTGQKFEGQVHLSAVVAAGLSPVSHVISVGYASEAEIEAWADMRIGSADWAAFLNATQPISDYLGGSMSRNLKTWGPATLQDLTGN